MCSTNYGSRVDLQGWGENVTTTGYGDLFDGTPDPVDPNRFYTDTFGGTSAATAMVAGAVASFQGVAKDRGYELTADEVRNALHDTGTLQDAGTTTHNIGRLPNLKAAIDGKIPALVKLLSPLSGDEPNTLRPTLDWGSFYNATKYELQVNSGTSNGKLLIDTTTNNSIYTFSSNLTTQAKYYWRVRPMVNSVWLPWSDPWWFRPVAVSVPTTLLVHPDNGALINHPAAPPTFEWNVCNGVNSYDLDIATTSDFSTSLGPISVAADPLEPKTHTYDGTTLDPNTKYYWRVRCVNGGNTGAWTSSRILYTSLDPVGSLTAPVGGVAVYFLRPEFSWEVVPGAKAYYLQVSTSPTFSGSPIFTATINIASGETVPNNFYQMKSDLNKRNSTLYWRVRVQGKYGWSAYNSTLSSFTTGNPPGVPSLSKPSSGAKVSGPDDVEMVWSTPKGALNFWLQISTTSDFTDFIQRCG